MSASPSTDILRDAAPYVQRHRGKLFVIFLDSALVDRLGEPAIERLLMDAALLHCFDIRVAMVFGVRHSLDRALAEQGLPGSFGDHDNWRVTDAEQLEAMKRVVAERQELLADRLRQAPLHYGSDASRFDVLTDQRLVLARPYGIHGGTDYQYTGVVHKVLADKLLAQAGLGNLALISPLAPSPTGQLHNLRAQEVALAVAAELRADKLIVIGANLPLQGSRSFYHAEELFRQMDALDGAEADVLKRIVEQSLQKRIGRLHFIDHSQTGDLLQELFTHEGSGIMVSCDPYEQFRPACADDLGRILELYRPARAKDEVVERDGEAILDDIGCYHLLLIDGVAIGVAALTPLERDGAVEIHGLAIDAKHRRHGRGRRLALSLIERARHDGHRELFALTTQAHDFFSALGMERVDVSALPPGRAKLMPKRRNSTVLRLKL